MRIPVSRIVRMACLLGLALRLATPVAAQGLPSAPIVLGDGIVTVGGDVSLTASCSHAAGGAACTADTGFFNYGDYEHSTLRMVRLGVSTSVRLGSHLTALGDVRMENTAAPRPYALYLRYAPFAHRAFDIQAGRIPPTFGAFPRRAYSADNLLIGYPLAYQYLTSLRDDAVPSTPDDLIRMRGRGWLSSFPIGNPTPEAGLPLANANTWDTGVQAHAGFGWLDVAASATTGSLADPRTKDNNTGRQVAARVSAHPITGFVVGASFSRAPYVDTATAEAAHATAASFTQRAAGADVEYSRAHYLLRAELVTSTFRLATIAPALHATAVFAEGRYKFTPRAHAALRLEHLGFNTVTGPARSGTWDAPVSRVELGGGYNLLRNVQLRVAAQHDNRDGGRVHHLTAVSTQLLYWF